MQIVCPNCSTAYQLAPVAIGANGRSVRCVRCYNIWFVPPPGVIPEITATVPTGSDSVISEQEAGTPTHDIAQIPPEDAPATGFEDDTASPPVSAEPADQGDGPADVQPAQFEDETPTAPEEPANVALSDIAIPFASAPPLAPEPGDGSASPDEDAIEPDHEDVERAAARRRARTAARRKQRMRIPLPVVIVLMLFICGALIGLRKDIVRHVPQMGSFYASIGLPVNLRGLVFSDVKISNETHDGVPVLVVEGLIASTVGVPVDVPRIRFALRNASGAEIYIWTAQPSQPVLEPGEALPFRSRLASPPAEGQDIQVRFFTRRDAAAGSR